MQRQSYAPLTVIDSPAALSGVIQLVDPMSEVDAKLAGAFLNGPLAKPQFIHFSDSFRVSFMRDRNYTVHTIRFSEELCSYAGKKGGIIRYAVKGPLIGAGAFCSVYRVTYTFKTNRDGTVVCKAKANDKWRAIKIFDKQSPGIYSKQEYAILSLIPSMHAKKNQYSPVRNAASLLMAYIPGEELAKCLRAHQDASKPLSVLQLLELSRELFAALDQLHQCHVIHRDIKLENIMVSFKPDGSINRVTFIDFNLAKKKGPAPNGNDGVGSPAYASPEAFANTLQDEKSDLYSLGRVLWCVWGLKVNFNEDYKSVFDFINYCRALTSLPFLFKGVAETALSLDQRKKIHDLLFAIHCSSQKNRPDAATAIKVFDDVIAEYKANLDALQIKALGFAPIIGGMRPDTSVCELASAAIKLQDEQTAHIQLPSIHCQQSSPLLFSPASAAAAVLSKPVPAKQARDNQCVLF